MFQQSSSNNGVSLFIGFIMAVGNHLFGWMNQITTTTHIPMLLQALLMGFFGAIGTFLGNRLIKFIKKILNKDGTK